ncbi:hypothetical protein NUW54_g12103 [Trametes sanguinea]|uniref:Uncharacterized protein n=1 Tax=Trametes sanguinea TaxID=158606 RepID=A0ACC1N313_9APHY|nr:hypothetical protein NUW54_g12103 [Trametes sanguinea]
MPVCGSVYDRDDLLTVLVSPYTSALVATPHSRTQGAVISLVASTVTTIITGIAGVLQAIVGAIAALLFGIFNVLTCGAFTPAGAGTGTAAGEAAGTSTAQGVPTNTPGSRLFGFSAVCAGALCSPVWKSR